MGRTVLIVDDSESVRQRVCDTLLAASVCDAFVTAGDGIEGIKVLATNKVDLVLCDVVMPEIDGFKLVKMIKSKPEYAKLPIIMLTATEDLNDKVRAFGAGASDYVVKPFHDEELVARVRVHLNLKELQDTLRESNLKLESLARNDSLTKIANRRYFMERFAQELERSRRYKHALGHAMLDIDHFKKINDEYGHQAGDQVLVETIEVIKRVIRDVDIIGRYGGEEFALIMPETDAAGALAVAERCRGEVEAHTVCWQDKKINVTISIGLVSSTAGVLGEFDTVDNLVALADGALYCAKDGGRNRVGVHQPSAAPEA